eukprot:m51a1_g9898 putative kinesin heavy chain (1745) ;mRNA; r:63098-72382
MRTVLLLASCAFAAALAEVYTGWATHFDAVGETSGCGVTEAAVFANEAKDYVALNVQDSPGSYYDFPERPLTDKSKIGVWDNGRNCGRFVRVTIGDYCDGQNGGGTNEGFCKHGTLKQDEFNGATLDLIATDSCHDSNGWNHLDILTASLSRFHMKDGSLSTGLPNKWNNRQIHWEWVKAPNYKGDIKVALYGQSQPLWACLVITHLPNGIHGVEWLQNGQWVKLNSLRDNGQVWEIKPNGQPLSTIRFRVYDVNDKLIMGGREYEITMPQGTVSQKNMPIEYKAYGGTDNDPTDTPVASSSHKQPHQSSDVKPHSSSENKPHSSAAKPVHHDSSDDAITSRKVGGQRVREPLAERCVRPPLVVVVDGAQGRLPSVRGDHRGQQCQQRHISPILSLRPQRDDHERSHSGQDSGGSGGRGEGRAGAEAREQQVGSGQEAPEGAMSIRVVCRVRPQNKSEIERDGTTCIEFPSPYEIKVKEHTFAFDRVFDGTSTQQMVYDDAAKPIVGDLFNGFNATIFAYGQTSSGKTHTMQGPSIDDPQLKGITPRIMDDIFNSVQNAPDDDEFTLKCSYLEIYMEKIRDLLDGRKQNLKVREDKVKGIYVEGATEVFVSNPQEVSEVIRVGQHNRAIAETSMNQQSSRSHSCFVLNVTHRSSRDQSTRSGRLYLVDLAGSEKVGKTGASGTTLDEAKMINKSLTALGLVINALTEGKGGHIPYRDSKLTRILQESLGGNSRTTLCINCSPSSYNMEETLSTLRFGARAKSIKNKARANVERSPAELKAMLAKSEAEIAKLQECIASLQEEVALFRQNPGAAAAAAGASAPVPVPPGAPQRLNAAAPEVAASPIDISTMPNVVKMKEHIEQLEAKLAAAEEEKTALVDAQEALKDQLTEKISECATSAKTIEQLRREAEAAERAAKESEDISRRLDEAATDLASVRSQLEQTNVLARMLEKENESLKRDLDEQQEQLSRNLASMQPPSASATPAISPQPIRRSASALEEPWTPRRASDAGGGSGAGAEELLRQGDDLRLAMQQSIDRMRALSTKLDRADLKQEMQAEVDALETSLYSPRPSLSAGPAGAAAAAAGGMSPLPAEEDPEVKKLSDMTAQAMQLLSSLQEQQQQKRRDEEEQLQRQQQQQQQTPDVTPIKSKRLCVEEMPQSPEQPPPSQSPSVVVVDLEEEQPAAPASPKAQEPQEPQEPAVVVVEADQQAPDKAEAEQAADKAETEQAAEKVEAEEAAEKAEEKAAAQEPSADAEAEAQKAQEQPPTIVVTKAEPAAAPVNESAEEPAEVAKQAEEASAAAEAEESAEEPAEVAKQEEHKVPAGAKSAVDELDAKPVFVIETPDPGSLGAPSPAGSPLEKPLPPAASSVPAQPSSLGVVALSAETETDTSEDEGSEGSEEEEGSEEAAATPEPTDEAAQAKCAAIAEAASEALRKQQEQHEAALRELRAANEQLAADKGELQQRLGRSEDEIAQLRKDAAEIWERLRATSESTAVAELRKELESAKAATEQKLADFEKLRGALVADLENRCLKVIELEVQLDEITEKYEMLRCEKPRVADRQVRRQMLTVVRDFQKAVLEIRKVHGENKRLQMHTESLQQQLQLRDKRIAELEKTVRELQKRPVAPPPRASQQSGPNRGLHVPANQGPAQLSFAQGAKVSKPLRGGKPAGTFLLHSPLELSLSSVEDSRSPSPLSSSGSSGSGERGAPAAAAAPEAKDAASSAVHGDEQISWMELLASNPPTSK